MSLEVDLSQSYGYEVQCSERGFKFASVSQGESMLDRPLHILRLCLETCMKNPLCRESRVCPATLRRAKLVAADCDHLRQKNNGLSQMSAMDGSRLQSKTAEHAQMHIL